MDIGRICVKIAGRDAGKKCVVLDVDGNFALVDGLTRRRKCNLAHLEPTTQTLDIKKNASHDDVKSAFQKIGITLKDRKEKVIKPSPSKKQ
ncbi:MAG: 50S ribosomal protein L14e [archaeon]